MTWIFSGYHPSRNWFFLLSIIITQIYIAFILLHKTDSVVFNSSHFHCHLFTKWIQYKHFLLLPKSVLYFREIKYNYYFRARHAAHIHRHIPDGAFQAITTETGERFYLNKIEDEEWDRQVTSLAAVQKSARFLNIPYSVLRARAENEVRNVIKVDMHVHFGNGQIVKIEVKAHLL